ncbi:hypothetical protein [Marinibacterium sp. SX1]|uniref:hypothetical protein n=1 Tax=Marinibacterium sp. SX1 TaxID=3388424 RepID=UPI003D17A2A0
MGRNRIANRDEGADRGAAAWRAVGRWWPVPVMILSLFATSFWLRLASGVGRDGGPVVLVFPPTWSQARTLAATASLDLPIVDGGAWPFVLAVQPDDPGRPGASARDGRAIARQARAAGAMLILSSQAPALCSTTFTNPQGPDRRMVRAIQQGD